MIGFVKGALLFVEGIVSTPNLLRDMIGADLLSEAWLDDLRINLEMTKSGQFLIDSLIESEAVMD